MWPILDILGKKAEFIVVYFKCGSFFLGVIVFGGLDAHHHCRLHPFSIRRMDNVSNSHAKNISRLNSSTLQVTWKSCEIWTNLFSAVRISPRMKVIFFKNIIIPLIFPRSHFPKHTTHIISFPKDVVLLPKCSCSRNCSYVMDCSFGRRGFETPQGNLLDTCG